MSSSPQRVVHSQAQEGKPFASYERKFPLLEKRAISLVPHKQELATQYLVLKIRPNAKERRVMDFCISRPQKMHIQKSDIQLLLCSQM